MKLRLLPDLGYLVYGSPHSQGVNFSRGAENPDHHWHVVFSALRIHDVVKPERLALLFGQTSKLPAHQGHKLCILINPSLDTDQFSLFF